MGGEFFAIEWSKAAETIVWELRLPKVLVVALTGSGLAIAGILMQALTKNSLADPFILGISSGAASGAVCTILIGALPLIGRVHISVGAFLGAILAAGLVYTLARFNGQLTTTTLVLTGMILSAVFGAITNVIIFLAPNVRAVSSALFWMTGSFSGILWEDVPLIAIAFFLSIVASALLARKLDLLLLGEDAARANGVHVLRLQTVIILLASLLTAVLVSKSGIIGFVGLVIPHISRTLVGSSHSRVFPISILAGAILMLWADLAARTLFVPQELPVGVITALIGAPFFLYLLRSRKYNF